MHAGAGLVDLVEHHHAAARAGFAQRLDDIARKRTDVGAAVAADLGLVVHPAQRHAHEFPPERLGDALAERSLAHAGRADEAQDRSVAVRIELAYCEEFQDALFYHLQPEMVLAQYASCLGDVDGAGLGRLPRQLDQPVEVAAHHRVFGGAVRHALQALQFLGRLLFDFFRHLRVGDRFPEFRDFGGIALVAFAEFLLDRFELLAQQILALALVHARLGAFVDLARQPQHLDALRQQFQHAVQAPLQFHRFEQLLFLGRLDIHQAGDHVGERRGGTHVLHRAYQLLRRLRHQLEHLERALLQSHEARLDFRAGRVRFFDQADAGHEEGIAVQQFDQAKALLALADDVMRAVRRRDVAQHVGARPHQAQVLQPGTVDLRIALQHYADRTLGLDRLLRARDRAFAADGDRQDHAREQHHVAHRYDDHRVIGYGERAARAIDRRRGRRGFAFLD